MDLSSNTVVLEKCPVYTGRHLADCCEKMLAPCLSSTAFRTKRVLLKPNLISARLGPLACTEGAFILAAARWFLDRGARVSVGDSPAFGTATSVLAKIGIVDALRGLGVLITDFAVIRPVRLPSGLQASLAADALDCDLLVNLPRVKAHAQLRVTLAVKNLFGCLVGMRKPLWHMVHGGQGGRFAEHLVELLSVLPDSISMVDGITAMQRTGPIGGQPFPLGLVAVSANPVAVDRALLKILGIEPEMSPLMEACRRLGCPGTDLTSLVFPALSPSDLVAPSFVAPAELHPVRFNFFRFLRRSLHRMLLKLGLLS